MTRLGVVKPLRVDASSDGGLTVFESWRELEAPVGFRAGRGVGCYVVAFSRAVGLVYSFYAARWQSGELHGTLHPGPSATGGRGSCSGRLRLAAAVCGCADACVMFHLSHLKGEAIEQNCLEGFRLPCGDFRGRVYFVLCVVRMCGFGRAAYSKYRRVRPFCGSEKVRGPTSLGKSFYIQTFWPLEKLQLLNPNGAYQL